MPPCKLLRFRFLHPGLLATVLLLTVFGRILGQQPAYFVMGEGDFEGIQVYDVIQDSDYNYCFATDQGFYFYDGYSFRPIPMQGVKGRSGFGLVKNSKGAIYGHNLNNQILRITEKGCRVIHELKTEDQATDLHLCTDSQDRLMVWGKSVLVFDQRDSLLHRQRLLANYFGFPYKALSGKVFVHMLGVTSLAIWEGDEVRYEQIKTDEKAIDGVLKFFRIKGLTYAVNVKNKQLYQFEEDSWSLRRIPSEGMLEKDEFLRFYNENDQLWVAGTVSGVQLLTDPVKQRLAPVMFGETQVTDVFQDHEGNLLLSTANQGVIVVPDLSKPDAIPVMDGKKVVSLEMDSELGLLLGTDHGQLLQRQGERFVTLSAEGTRPLNSLFSWPDFPFILFDDGMIKVKDKRGGSAIEVYQGSLKDAGRGEGNSVWMALNLGVVEMKWEGGQAFSFERHPQLHSRTNAVAWDSAQQLLYAATSEGLKIASRNGSVHPVIVDGNPLIATDLHFENESMYVSGRDLGILQFLKGSMVRQIRPQVAGDMPEILAFRIREDHFFLNTTRGLLVMDGSGRVIYQLNKANGFATNRIFDFIPIDSALWVCHNKGLQLLPDLGKQSSAKAPLIRLASVTVNDSLIPLSQSGVDFGSGQFKFRFELTSPTLRNRENIRYHYRLEGYDDKWQHVPYKDNLIVYNGLPSGNYRFLAFSENQGRLSPTVSFAFHIAAPVYLRWWFILLANTAVLGILFLFFYLRFARQRRRAELLSELNMSKLKAIQSQMNPHFIFNSLNSIQDLVLQGDVDNSYTYITKFAKLVRQTLRFSEMDFIEIEQEMELLELYLTLEKLRFQEDFDFEMDAKGVEDVEIPPMLIQPFVENALVHGLLHKEGHRKLRVSFRMEGQVVCTVEDNGIGREKAMEIKRRQRGSHESFAMEAIKRRFEILQERHGNEIGVEFEDLIEDGKAAGTRVVVRLPTKSKF